MITYADISAMRDNLATQQANIATAADPLADLTRSQSWSLDALGNFVSLTNNDGTPQEREHNLQNQVTEVGSVELSFDANGNMTGDEQGRTLVWDGWNRLVRVEYDSETLVEYQYDALKRRIVEQHGTSPARLLYYSDQWQVIEERESGSTSDPVQAQYVWSPVYVDSMILRDRNADGNPSNGFESRGLEERIYVMHDANFNVTAIVDTEGEVLERYYYEAYGRAVYLDGDFELLPDAQSDHAWQHLHQGGRLDFTTGNYHFRHRDLSPTLGRWISQDPIGFEGSPWNLYEFAECNPTNLVDPEGLWSWNWGDAAIGCASGAVTGGAVGGAVGMVTAVGTPIGLTLGVVVGCIAGGAAAGSAGNALPYENPDDLHVWPSILVGGVLGGLAGGGAVLIAEAIWPIFVTTGNPAHGGAGAAEASHLIAKIRPVVEKWIDGMK